MAGITLAQRDLPDTRARLGRWFEEVRRERVTLSELEVASRTSGWSSECLKFSARDADGTSHDYVIRIPPSGGGLYRDYDLEGQARTQELVRGYGVATPSPIRYEPDAGWIGSPFIVMPRIAGHIPSDLSYPTRGWLHDAAPAVQRRAHDSFLETLVALHRVPMTEAPWLARPTGVGTTAELTWWRDFVDWGTGSNVPDVLSAAFDWLTRHQPEQTDDLVVSWGDARLSNAIFADDGTIVGVLDWEQACWCPAEVDFAWWLAVRRQTVEANGLDLDPELPGFDGRERVIARFEALIGRRLVDLGWYEAFAMVRMGCCIVRMQTLLRAIGQGDHMLTKAPILPAWTMAVMS